jgi:hypothetical protein
MFYGRDRELKKLNEMFDSGKFEFAVIYGRRRVGKTTLIREFIKDKKALFFAASETTDSDNLAALSKCIGGRNNAPIFQDYESMLSEVFDMGEKERLVFVIDEYPYLAESYRGISSLLQIKIDHRKDNSKLMIILCGSSMSFMEYQVLGYKSPLFGRRTAQFKILPFEFYDSLPFFSDFKPIDKAILYGMTGGIPEYLNRINSRQSVRENIIDLFLTPTGHLFEEPSNLIKQELREPSTYNVIIEAIAGGASRLSEIAAKCKLESNKCAKYLTSLITLGLVSKESPYNETSTKKSIYKLEDFMFRFWYRFVFSNMSAIVAGAGEDAYNSEVEGQINAYMGLIFEEICKQYLWKIYIDGRVAVKFKDISRWWGSAPKTKSQVEIDIMGVSHDKNTALFAECKWTNEKVDLSVLEGLIAKSELFSYAEKHFYLFAKTGFSKGCVDRATVLGNVTLVEYGDMV